MSSCVYLKLAKCVSTNTNNQSGLTAYRGRRLSYICAVQQVVIRVAELAVAEFHPGKKIIQRMVVNLHSKTTRRK